MKKQTNNSEVQTIQTEAIEKKAIKATTKKEEKKMSETIINIPENLDQNMLKAYKANEAGELLMTEEMMKEFFEAHPEVKKATTKKDATMIGIKADPKAKPFAIIRLTEDAKKKQVHIHTGATKKVCSARNEADGMRYKVIFVQAKNRYELWSAGNDGKRKKMLQGTENEVMAQYNELIGTEKKATQVSKKATKKSA